LLSYAGLDTPARYSLAKIWIVLNFVLGHLYAQPYVLDDFSALGYAKLSGARKPILANICMQHNF